MKKIQFILIFSCLQFCIGLGNAQQSVIGKWKTIDDDTGEARSIVEIYKQGNKLYGKVEKVIQEEDQNKTCIKCEGENYNKPIKGLVILKDLEKDGQEYEDGTILDPENGKVYRCKIWLDEDNPDVLNVRGYIAFLYRTQQWLRI
ncbi:DUF2147 domain-containing protein [Aquimarina brevivitae]|uniref:Uncharacterized protein (DUF2147 family) n=1 Tax=Aquimarina brevivitae TaxID=323412 RepID=A0A4Q7NU49_9FLAO|nr:DUF2147 domain-containing protein [Aquimarina brevivitae]RZS90711.1 uncharacterized protein (DUF2147 family) [Aquimarina brevivitae]